MKKLLTPLAFACATVPAFANTSNGAEFQNLYSKVVAYLTGIPGIMAALAILATSLYLAFFGGRGPLVFFGGVIAAAAIFLLPTIVQGMGGTLF
ncbi:MAG: hypothetical protein QW228_06230 [Candidatus Aenigmatarchaeota archaeon]